MIADLLGFGVGGHVGLFMLVGYFVFWFDLILLVFDDLVVCFVLMLCCYCLFCF